MEMNAKDMHEILKTVAIQEASGEAAHGLAHGSRIARIQVSSWQAEIIRTSQEVPAAKDSAELRTLMSRKENSVIFLPHEAGLTAEIVDRICRESPFDKLLIWERG